MILNFPRRCRQVPIAQEISAAEDDLGRRGDGLLFQRKESKRAERLLHTKSVSCSANEGIRLIAPKHVLEIIVKNAI